MRLFLASESPRRRELLARLGFDFETESAGVAEISAAADPRSVPLRNAESKAAAVAARHPDALTLGADTVILHKGRIIGKPRDSADAAAILRALSGDSHEVITGLMALPERPAVGYLPTGTTNDFSRNLHLPRSVAGKTETAAGGVPRAVDIGRFNGDYFVYVAAFGAFTDVAYDTPQSFKNMFGHLAYVLEGAARLASLPHYRLRVEHDNGVEEGEFLYGMVSNTVSVGGFRGMPEREVKLDDGLFEVVLIRQPQNAAQLQSLLAALVQPAHAASAGGTVTAFHTSHLTVTCAEEMPWTLDGEFGGAHKVVEIENLPRALDIVYGK